VPAVGTIAIGLAVHRSGDALTPVVRDVLGDALWAAMMVCLVRAFVPAARWWIRGAVAVAICVAVELSQLYHAPGLDAIRRTTIGHLVLGNDFDPRDIGAYTLGVVAAVLLELALGSARRRMSDSRRGT
jgi:hypothetical protein